MHIESFREWIPIACSIVLTVATLSCKPLSRSESSPGAGEGTSVSVLSANRLYREFKDNPIDATDKYQGKTVALEGLVGQIIPVDHRETAVHIPDEKPTPSLQPFPVKTTYAESVWVTKFNFSARSTNMSIRRCG